jgi:hypothetical protein
MSPDAETNLRSPVPDADDAPPHAAGILVLSSGFPYPVDAGRKAVLAGFLDYAVATLGAENVVLLCVSSTRAEEEAAALAPCRVVFFRPAPAVVPATLVALNGLLLRRRAIQEMAAAAPAIAAAVAAFLKGFDPDIIFVDTIRMVQYAAAGCGPRQTVRAVSRRPLFAALPPHACGARPQPRSPRHRRWCTWRCK